MKLSTPITGALADPEVHCQDAPATGIRAVSITMVKNEQDIIEPFLRTNRPYLDAMFVMDNGSTDATRTIAMDCARELGGIFVVDSPIAQFAQTEQISAATKHVQGAFFADRIIFLDADEFLCALPPDRFHESLCRELPGTVTLHPWRTYLPDPEGPGGPDGRNRPDPVQSVRFVRREEHPVYTKAIWHLGGAVAGEMLVMGGSHRVRLGAIAVPEKPRPDLPLVHIPVRSADQLIGKAIGIWVGRVATAPDLAAAGPGYTGRSDHRKRLFDEVRALGPSLKPSEVSRLAMGFAQSSPPANFRDNASEERPAIDLTRRHSDGHGMPAERAVFTNLFPRYTPDYAALVTSATIAGATDSLPASGGDAPTVVDWSRNHLDVAPFRFLAETFTPRSALDIGCGKGLHLRLLVEFGVTDIIGTDLARPETTVLAPHQYRRHDLHHPLDLGRAFDLVLCLDVVQHLDPAVTEQTFDTIARHARERIVFSVAAPGQPGHGHVNCLGMDRALALWAKRGWVPGLVDSLGLRAISTLTCFRRNLIVLHRASPPDDDTASAALRSIAAMDYLWYGQKAGIRAAPFSEPYPPDTRAFGRVRPRKA